MGMRLLDNPMSYEEFRERLGGLPDTEMVELSYDILTKLEHETQKEEEESNVGSNRNT